MLTDVIGLGMALAAIQLASRYERTDRRSRDGTAPSQHTFGLYRLEILAAFVNALLLFGVAVYVLVEAVRRLSTSPRCWACRCSSSPWSASSPTWSRSPCCARGQGVAQRARAPTSRCSPTRSGRSA